MEQYKEKLKISCYISGICCVILAAFSIFCICAEAGIVELTPIVGDSHWQSRWRGFVTGASMGILVYMVIGLVRSLLALKDEKKLKKLYVEGNDERQVKIWTSARAAAMQLTTALGLVAVIVAGYFSITVSLTILACIFTASITSLLLTFYYSKKF